MKKFLFLPIAILLFLSNRGTAQVLNVPEIFQEQNQWCWAGTSKCVLDYYGDTLAQCDIAEYARTQITWTSFGTVNCCVDPNQGCNYWNFNYGAAGSIQDILIHFGGITNIGLSYAFSLAEINTEIAAARPFVIRWGWSAGGGHFIVGNGVNGNDVNIMNPWPGEGSQIVTYSWLLTDGNHTWTHTNRLTTSPMGIETNFDSNADVSVFPNPASEQFTISINDAVNIQDAEIVLTDVAGREVMKAAIQNSTTNISTEKIGSGIYFYQVINSGELLKNGKIVVE